MIAPSVATALKATLGGLAVALEVDYFVATAGGSAGDSAGGSTGVNGIIAVIDQ